MNETQISPFTQRMRKLLRVAQSVDGQEEQSPATELKSTCHQLMNNLNSNSINPPDIISDISVILGDLKQLSQDNDSSSNDIQDTGHDLLNQLTSYGFTHSNQSSLNTSDPDMVGIVQQIQNWATQCMNTVQSTAKQNYQDMGNITDDNSPTLTNRNDARMYQ